MTTKLRLVRPGDTVAVEADAKQPDIIAVLLEDADLIAAGDERAIADAPFLLRGAASLIALMRTARGRTS